MIRRHGFGDDAFPHGTGHGVGFAAIDHTARPRLHPAADDVLQPGMVFNVEPAIYLEGYGGLRHCDMVVVTPSGAEVLTPFQTAAGELRTRGSGRGRVRALRDHACIASRGRGRLRRRPGRASRR